MIIDPLTGNMIKDVQNSEITTDQNDTVLRSPREGTRESEASAVQIINPNTGQTVSGNEKVSQINPLAEGTPDKGSQAYDYLYGSVVEVPRDLVWGAVTWPVAQLVRHSAVAGQKIQQSLGLLPKMSPEQQSAMGENAANWIQTLGGLATPKTETGKASIELAGKVIEPINKFAHWTAQGINPETHPNLHNVIATGVEFGVFATIPKVGKGLGKLAKDRASMMKMKGKAKQEAAIKIAKDQGMLLKELEDSIAKGEHTELIADKGPTKSDLSQRGKGFEGDVRTPTKIVDPKTGLETSTLIKPEEAKIIDPETGTKLVEEIPGDRSVYQILTDPLKNESGAIKLPFTQKQFKEVLSPEIRQRVRDLGKLAEEAGVEFNDFLKTKGMDNKQIKEISRLHKLAKEEAPLQAAKTKVKEQKGDFKTNELEKGDIQVNLNKEANPNVKIGLKDVKAFAKVKTLKAGGLLQGLTTPENFFSTNKSIKPLLHMKRARDKSIAADTKILTEYFKEIENRYTNKKLRKEAGALQHSKSKFGSDAMETMGVKVNSKAKYAELNTELTPFFKSILERVNDVRVKAGRKPIREMKDFLAFFAEENFFRDMKELVGGDFNKQGPSLIHDSIETISGRHKEFALDMANFNHVKREGLRKGVKLELDPLVIAQRYASEAMPIIHYADINTFVKEIMTKDLTMPNGNTVNLGEVNPGLRSELVSWSNSLVGKSNSPLPHLVEKQLRRLRKNLTTATLVGNFRTTGIQPTALATTFTEMPGRTIKAGFDFLTDLGRKNKKFNRDRYNSLPDKSGELTAVDVSFSDPTSAIGGTKGQKIGAAATKTLSFVMKELDYIAREITARAKESELKQAVKEGRITEQEMIQQVDSTVVRTQSSGAKGEVSPIQRNELGRILTLWQTFTIGHVNWLAKEVLGIKNPEATPARTSARVFRYITTMAALGYMFEDLIGIQAPGPAPIQAVKRAIQSGDTDLLKLALTAGRELSELIPFGSSIKFGSSIFGPVVDFLKQVTDIAAGTGAFNQDVLVKANNGDVKSIIKILEIAGKFKGVPGTAQIAKTARGLLRDENLLRALLGHISTKKKTGKSKSSRKSSRKRRTKRR